MCELLYDLQPCAKVAGWRSTDQLLWTTWFLTRTSPRRVSPTLLSLFPSCFSSSRADGAQSRSSLMRADYPIFCYMVHLVSYPPYRPPFPDQTRSIGESAQLTPYPQVLARRLPCLLSHGDCTGQHTRNTSLS